MQDNNNNTPAFDLAAPAIYVADLAEYNNGRLVGKWIAIAGHTAATLLEEMTAFVSARGHEEWAIHDYNNLPLCSEWPDLEIVIETAQLVTSYDFETVSGYIDYFGTEQLSEFEEKYQGAFATEEIFAHELVDDCYDLEKCMGSLSNYFDYGAFARDLFMGDYVSVRVPEGVAVFRND
ncbi:antirestriction protein ArdA [soil metagenome]